MTGAVAVQKERCGRCGKVSPVTAAFCPRCGVRLRDVSPVLQAEVLDAEPVPQSWEVLEPPPIRPIPAIPVIPKAPPFPRGFAAPSWSGPQPMAPPAWSSAPRPTTKPNKPRRWMWIMLGVFVVRAMSAFSTHSASSSSSTSTYNASTPPPRSSPVYQPYHPPTSPRHRY
jgi:hypothetical protein